MDECLYVIANASLGGRVFVFDVSIPDAPARIAAIQGLGMGGGATWLALAGDRLFVYGGAMWAWASVWEIDVTDPAAARVLRKSVIEATAGGPAEEYRGVFAAGLFACVLNGGQLHLIYPSQ